MVNGSIQSELSRFFQILENTFVTLNSVTAAAFCKARKKFSFTAFTALNTNLTTLFYCSAFVQRWNGFRLLAVDGSIVTLPEHWSLFNFFGKTNDHARYPSARLSQLYDVINKLSIDVLTAPFSTGERTLAASHLEHATTRDLILYDRGYPAFWLFALHLQRGIPFCARVSVDFSNLIRNFVTPKHKDAIVIFPVSDASVAECKARSIPLHPITLRLIRIELDSGETEVLITSLLDAKRFPRKTFLNLYHQRWFVEEDYKVMKSRIEIENFSGLSVEAVKQDIHAKILTKNLAAIAIVEADVLAQEKYKHRKRTYKINFTYTLSQLKDNIIRFTLCVIPSDLISIFIQHIAGFVNAVRPERKFERNMKKINRKRHHIAYKRVG